MRWVATLAFTLKSRRAKDPHLMLAGVIMVKWGKLCEHIRDLNDSHAHFVERILNSGVL